MEMFFHGIYRGIKQLLNGDVVRIFNQKPWGYNGKKTSSNLTWLIMAYWTIHYLSDVPIYKQNGKLRPF